MHMAKIKLSNDIYKVHLFGHFLGGTMRNIWTSKSNIFCRFFILPAALVNSLDLVTSCRHLQFQGQSNYLYESRQTMNINL